jgi:hypothetical protein
MAMKPALRLVCENDSELAGDKVERVYAPITTITGLTLASTDAPLSQGSPSTIHRDTTARGHLPGPDQ